MPLTPIEKLPEQSVKEMGEGEVTKAAIRQTVWKYLESNNLVKFPRPVYRRIPNFEGAAAAGEKASTLDEFKNAKIVKINPDKPQENSRFLTLEAEKTLLVPTPRLREGLFNKINPPAGCNKDILRICATAQGVREYSSPISLDDTIEVDLVIVGSVAVSKAGLRIGKGEGFADMEFAMMRCMKAVNENTVVISTVHDCQIIDIPESLMEAHDLTVDYIVTETQVIKCDRTRPKPDGIIWSKITPEKMRQVPILKIMREKDKAAGKDTTLKDGREESDLPPEREENEEQDGENRRPYRRRPYQYRRRFRRYRDSGSKENAENEAGGDHEEVNGEKTESGNEDNQDKQKGRPRRQFYRRRRFRRRRNENSQGDRESDEQQDNKDESDEGRLNNENQENRPPRRRRRFRRQPRQRRTDSGENDGERTSENQENEKPRDNRRRRPKNRSQSEGNESGNENQENPGRRRPFRPRKSMPTIFFGSLPRSLRVSELKTKVRENNINPLRVIWNGGQGHAFFQFQNTSEMETALESLKDFEIKGRKLRIEVANRSRQRGDNSDKEGSSNEQSAEGGATQSQAASNDGENAS